MDTPKTLKIFVCEDVFMTDTIVVFKPVYVVEIKTNFVYIIPEKQITYSESYYARPPTSNKLNLKII
jgi:hypothetical protein